MMRPSFDATGKDDMRPFTKPFIGSMAALLFAVMALPAFAQRYPAKPLRSEEHTSELQSH